MRKNFGHESGIEDQCVLVDGPNLLLDCARECRGSNRAAREKYGGIVKRILEVEQIGLRRRRRVEAVLMNIADDSDDFRPRLVIMASTQLNSFSEGIFSREHLSRGHFADDGHLAATG